MDFSTDKELYKKMSKPRKYETQCYVGMNHTRKYHLKIVGHQERTRIKVIVLSLSILINLFTTFGQNNINGISINKFIAILSTEVESEFEFGFSSSSRETVMKQWDAATSYEWSRSFQFQSRRTPTPFFICSDISGSKVSGSYRREQIILNLSQISKFANKKSLLPAYNREDESCFFASMLASDAKKLSDSFSIQPMNYAMKLLKNSIVTARYDQPFLNPIIDAVLCPGVIDPTQHQQSEKLMKISMIKFLESDLRNDLFWTSSTTASQHGNFWIDLLSESYEKSCKDLLDRLDIVFDYSSKTDHSSTFVTFSFQKGSDIIEKSCSLSLLLGIALMPQTCSVQVRPEISAFNLQAQWITQSGVENVRPFFNSSITGKGQIVSVSDTGLDTDNCYFYDDSIIGQQFQKNGILDLEQRKVVYYDSFVDDTDVLYGHGTHVCGTIAGNKKNESNDDIATGIAKDAKIAFIDIGHGYDQIQIPTIERMLGTGRPDSRIHAAPWGTRNSIYGIISHNFDNYIYDNDDLLVVVAAGNNDGSSVGIGCPGSAKNTLTVGSSQSAGPDLLRSQRGQHYLSMFSAKGPTGDGRTKPDVVAPGSFLLSSGSQPQKMGECDPPISDLPKPGEEGRDGVNHMEGTSVATAVVAGSAALVGQYFEDGWYPSGKSSPAYSSLLSKCGSSTFSDACIPSGALVKAVLMNGAQYLDGIDNGYSGIQRLSHYDESQNFGKISLIDSVYLSDFNNERIKVWDGNSISDFESDEFEIRLAIEGDCVSNNLSITLAWMDPPSAPGCKSCLLNDLDLSAMKNQDSIIIYPNELPGKDSNNNVERIQMTGLNNKDIISVVVSATNLITSTQNYALVARGCFDVLSTEQGNKGMSDGVNGFLTSRIFVLGASFLLTGFLCVLCAIWLESRG